MITLIIAVILLVVLLAFSFFIPLKNMKTLIMSAIVMLLLLLTIVDQIVAPKITQNKPKVVDHFQTQALPNNMILNVSSSLYKSTPARNLLKQERLVLAYLNEKQSSKENFIVSVKNIDRSRFRAILRQFQTTSNILTTFVDFGLYNYKLLDFENALEGGKAGSKKYYGENVYFIIDNIKSVEHVNVLQNLFINHNVSLIIENFPYILMQMSSLGKWTYEYQFEGNYLAQVLQNHPPRLVEICNKYRTIDYTFYILSQSEPLSQLCTKLPSNAVTQCIRQYMLTAQDRIPYSRVRKCFAGAPNGEVDGVLHFNGLIGLKKEYFYAGKVDKGMFLYDNQSENL